MDSKIKSLEEVKNILKNTSKGRLVYDRNWEEEGRTEDIITDIKHRLVSMTLSPDNVIPRYEDITPEPEDHDDGGEVYSQTVITEDQPIGKKEVTETIVVSPEQARQLLQEYDNQRKQEVKDKLKEQETLTLEQLRDIDFEADERLRVIRSRHVNASIDRIVKLNRDISDYINSVVISAQRLSSSSQSSYLIEKKLKEVEEKKKEAEQQQERKAAQDAEQSRRQRIQQRIQSITSHKTQAENIIREFLPILTKTIKAFQFQQDHPLAKHLLKTEDNVSQALDTFDCLSKIEEPTDEDVLKAKQQFNMICQLKNKVQEMLEKINAELENQKQAQLDETPVSSKASGEAHTVRRKILNEEPKTAAPLVSSAPSSLPSITKGLKECVSKQKLIQDVKQRLEPFSGGNDPRIKQYRLKLQQFIRTQINAISPESNDHLKQKYQKLAALFDGQDIEFQDNRINCKAHPLAQEFCMFYAAQTFVSVGCKQIQSVPKASFCFGAIISLLWSRFPDKFGEVFMAVLVEKCPYITGYYPARNESESEAEYFISCGYSYAADGETLESEESFLNRMRSFARLYGAVIASKPPLTDNHPHGMKHAWMFLATTLSGEPRPGITAAMIHAFLSVIVHRLLDVFKGQLMKMLVFIHQDYIPRIEANSCQELKKQSVVQLKMFVEDCLKKIPRQGSKGVKPEGVLSEYFWQKSYLHS